MTRKTKLESRDCRDIESSPYFDDPGDPDSSGSTQRELQQRIWEGELEVTDGDGVTTMRDLQ